MKQAGVYAIRNAVTAKCYVGSSVDLVRRRATHFRELRKGVHKCVKLQHSWNKHGEQAFSFEVLEQTTSAEDVLRPTEQHWINTLDSYHNGYNVNPVAGNAGRMPKSAEHRARIGAARRGCKHSPEARAAISEKAKGRVLTPEHISALAAGRKAAPPVVWSAASRALLSSKRAGVSYGPHSPEHCAAISAGKTGKPLSDHHKQRIREGLAARRKKGNHYAD